MYIMLNYRYGLIGACLLAVPQAVPAGDESALLLESRELTAKYATQLKAALQEAMSTGGPVAAIDVCKEHAPAISSELSRESGASIGRTSLRFRNPTNAPDEWEKNVLASFTAAGDEHLEETASGDTRYMKAIPTGAVCLTCHGTSLSPEIEANLDARYPHDRARGYALNDIRGAFTIRWPATE
jgi:hypothetical protein